MKFSKRLLAVVIANAVSVSAVLADTTYAPDVANLVVAGNSDSSAHNEGATLQSSVSSPSAYVSVYGLPGGSGTVTLSGSLIDANGSLDLSGSATIGGATTINNTLVVDSGAGSDELTVGTGTISTVGTLTQTGTTNINTTGSSATTIGRSTFTLNNQTIINGSTDGVDDGIDEAG